MDWYHACCGGHITELLHRLSLRLRLARLRRTIVRALALAPRGFVPRDVLVLKSFSVRVRLDWRTRDVHPWDRVLAPERERELFREQALRDTEAAIVRCFSLLPELQEIDVCVLEPRADTAIFRGTVARRDAEAVRDIASPRMRLELMGIRATPAANVH